MGCSSALNIKNVPMNAIWETKEEFCLSTKNLTADDLGGKYFLAYLASGTKYKIWFDVDNASTEPTVASTTALVVELTTGMTAAQIATAIKAATDAVGAFTYTSSITNDTHVGYKYDDFSKVSSVEDGTAGELLDLTRVAIGGSIDLGLLDGDVTFDPSVETQDITAHQTGAVVLSQNVTGLGGTVSLTLKEYSPSRYREIYEAVGGRVAGTSLVGMGSAMVGRNLFLYAKQLKLVPVGDTGNTNQYTFWKAVPDLGSHTFSGENPTTLPMEFTCYIDSDLPSEVNVWMYGDPADLP